MKRRILMISVLAVFLVAGGAVALWYFVHGQYHESTDDAYVGGNQVQITPQLAGTVLSIYADDTDYVKTGQRLIELDKSDAHVALDQA